MAGSIEKRGKNSYRLTVSEGFDLNGKPMIHRKTVHGTKKDAEVELAKFVTEVQNGLVIDGKSLKFSEFTEGKEIMVQKNLLHQHINDIAEC